MTPSAAAGPGDAQQGSDALSRAARSRRARRGAGPRRHACGFGHAGGRRRAVPPLGSALAESDACRLLQGAAAEGELIHPLEHGQAVVYHDAPGFKALSVLKRWTGQFAGPWSALIAVPHTGLGDDVVLTAWRRRLRLDAFDGAVLAAFMDANMGRGPENPVR